MTLIELSRDILKMARLLIAVAWLCMCTAFFVSAEDHLLQDDPQCSYIDANHTKTTGFQCKNGECIPLSERYGEHHLNQRPAIMWKAMCVCVFLCELWIDSTTHSDLLRPEVWNIWKACMQAALSRSTIKCFCFTLSFLSSIISFTLLLPSHLKDVMAPTTVETTPMRKAALAKHQFWAMWPLLSLQSSLVGNENICEQRIYWSQPGSAVPFQSVLRSRTSSYAVCMAYFIAHLNRLKHQEATLCPLRSMRRVTVSFSNGSCARQSGLLGSLSTSFREKSSSSLMPSLGGYLGPQVSKPMC